MAPHGAEISFQIRKRIVEMHLKGSSYQKISDALLISRNTVAKVVQRSNKTGHVINIKRSGRPMKLTARDERHLKRTLEANRKTSASELASIVKVQSGTAVSSATVSVHFIDWDCVAADLGENHY